jgi:hypothetical protein
MTKPDPAILQLLRQATEWRLLGLLFEAYARNRGDGQQAAITARAAVEFIAQHVPLIAEPLARAMATGDIQYLQLAAASLLQRVGPADSVFRRPGHWLSDAAEAMCRRRHGVRRRCLARRAVDVAGACAQKESRLGRDGSCDPVARRMLQFVAGYQHA